MTNKYLNIALFSAALAFSASTMAMGGFVEQGKNFSNISGELGKTSSGLYIEGSWTKNTDDGVSYGGAGLGYNLKLGPLMLNAGAKAVYLEPRKGDDGVAFPIGGGISLALPAGFALYGEGYSAPNGLTNSVKNYVEADGGISWSPVGPVIVKAGYRYAGVDGKDGHAGHTLVDGPYIGLGAQF